MPQSLAIISSFCGVVNNEDLKTSNLNSKGCNNFQLETQLMRNSSERIAIKQICLIESELKAELGVVVFKPRLDLPGQILQAPFNWGMDPHCDRNWRAQLQMWRALDGNLFFFEKTLNPCWLDVPLALIDDWYHFHESKCKESTYAWGDMIVGNRALRLAYLISAHQHGVLPLSDVQKKTLLQLVRRHLEFLLNSKNVAYSNHTFADLRGLAALAQVVDNATRTAIESFLDTHVPQLLTSQFNEDGVHLEHSPEYQGFGIRCLRQLQDSNWFLRFDVDKLLKRASKQLQLLRLPDGRVAPVGDSTAKPDGSVVSIKPSLQILNSAGYGVVRELRGPTSQEATYILLMGGFHSRFHKHSDDLSLLWFEGEDILCDTGKYAYKTDDKRNYAVSTRAHNTIEIDDANSWDYSYSKITPAYGSAIERVEKHPWGYLLRGKVLQQKFGVTHTRTVLLLPARLLLVVDDLSSQEIHTYCQWWHFASHIDIANVSGSYEGYLRSGKNLQIQCISSSEMNSKLIKGATDPMQGWVSMGYRNLTPNWALGFTGKFSSGTVVTLFSLDGEADARIEKNLIDLKVGKDIFILDCNSGSVRSVSSRACSH